MGCFQKENFFWYTLKLPSVYLRLMPKEVRTREGNPHVTVAPIKLFRAQNNQHSNHPATKFARATTNVSEDFSGLLGSKQVTFHCQHDKAKVELGLPAANKEVPTLIHIETSYISLSTGLPAANKEVPILIHIEYEVGLPHHNFTVAPMNKLIPSIIGASSTR